MLSDEERAIDQADWQYLLTANRRFEGGIMTPCSPPELLCPVWKADGSVVVHRLGPVGGPPTEDPRVQQLRDACDA